MEVVSLTDQLQGAHLEIVQLQATIKELTAKVSVFNCLIGYLLCNVTSPGTEIGVLETRPDRPYFRPPRCQGGRERWIPSLTLAISPHSS